MFFVKSTDNAKIAVYDLNPESRKTVVLVHGWPLSHKMFEYQKPALLKEGYRVVSIDIRGFGNSDETADGYEYKQLATDLYCVVRALNLTNFALVGFSMGGAIVTRYMAQYNGYGVNKLCYWDAAIPSYCKTSRNPFGQSLEDTDKLIRLGYQDRPALNQYFGSIFFDQKHSDSFNNWIQRISDDASGTGEMKCLISLRNEDVFDDLKHIKVPTAILHGKQDKICSFKMAEIVHRNIRTSRLYPFEHAGHGAFYDDQEQFTRVFVNFLNS